MPISVPRRFCLLAFTFLTPLACVGKDEASAGGEGSTRQVLPGEFVITAQGLSFSAPSQVQAGWTTLRLDNQGAMTHFALVERLPEGVTLEDQQREVAPVFQDGMDLLNAGKPEAALARFGELPAWYSDVVFVGGPGLVAGGEQGATTVYLEAGTYLLECYVKTAGVFHSFRRGGVGMVHQFTVTPGTRGAPEPEPTLRVRISSDSGITAPDSVAAGAQIVAVAFQDQQVHKHFLGHDVHLVRLDEHTDMGELASWMDWTTQGGLETPAPVAFLGGVQEMPAGSTGYVHVTLTPGRYAWIAEVPKPAEKRMLHVFTVMGDERQAQNSSQAVESRQDG